jgi:hypothetical protein
VAIDSSRAGSHQGDPGARRKVRHLHQEIAAPEVAGGMSDATDGRYSVRETTAPAANSSQPMIQAVPPIGTTCTNGFMSVASQA